MSRFLPFILLFLGAAHAADTPVYRADFTKVTWHGARMDALPKGLVLFFQGGHCRTVKGSPFMTGFERMRPEYAYVAIDPYGASDPIALNGCSMSHWTHAKVSQRVDDAIRVVNALSKRPGGMGNILVVGAGEGGAVAADFARQYHQKVRRVIIVNSLTGRPRRDLWEQATTSEKSQNEAHYELAMARRFPTMLKFWMGRTYLWWKDMADRVPAGDLVKTTIPVLLIKGDRDKTSPLEFEEQTKDFFQVLHLCTLSFRPKLGLDHELKDVNGKSHMAAIVGEARAWLREPQGCKK